MDEVLRAVINAVLVAFRYTAGFGWAFVLVLGILLLVLGRRKLTGLVLIVVALTWVGAFLLLDYTNTRRYDRVRSNFASVKPGMTPGEVEDLLGEPQSTFPPGSGLVFKDPNRLWAYYRQRSMAYPTSDFPFWKVRKYEFISLSRLFGPSSSDYVVAFDPQKNAVAKTTYPSE